MAYQEFYELEAWKLARRFKKEINALLPGIPESEKYDLRSQLLRAARSVQANIAEGHGRQSPRDETRFLAIARGSLAECLNHLLEAYDMGYVKGEKVAELKALYDETGRTLNGYMRYVKSKIPLSRAKENKNEEPPGLVEEFSILYGTDDADATSEFLEALKSTNDEQSGR